MSVPLPQLRVARPPGDEPVAEAPPPDAPPRERVPADPALATWLETTCSMIPGVTTAAVVLDDGVQAHWPRAAPDAAELLAIAATLLDGTERTQMIAADPPATVFLARRLAAPDGRAAALVMHLPQPADRQRETLFALVDWSETWLRFALTHARERVTGVPGPDVLTAGLEAATPAAAAGAMASLLVAAHGADGAAIGLARESGTALVARSGTASPDARTQANRAIAAAMDEALDEGRPVTFPPLADDPLPPAATRAHAALRTGQSLVAVCTVPLGVRGRTLGALTLMRHRGEPFSAAELARLADAAAPVALVLDRQLAAARGARARLGEDLANRLSAVFGPASPVRRVAGVLALLILAALLLVEAPYRVAAPAVLEGRVHQTLVSPVDGYVAEAPARAGDAVRTGDLLAVLDTRALEFERRRWASERAEAEKALRHAVARLDRPEAAVAKARVGKAGAQLELVEAQIGRARIVAPFDGLVISGDLSRTLGAPMTRGDVLFEIAPLDDYRVELEVDERLVADVTPGQTGTLALAALPGEHRPFTVTRVNGVAQTRDGRNAFVVEATLAGDPSRLRPGMHGVGRIEVGERPLFVAWMRPLYDRVRLWLWSRAP